LALVATTETPDAPRLDQPAAQPPAVVEQGDLLPAKPKPKVKKKRAKPKPMTTIPDDFYPNEKTLTEVIGLGFSREEALAELGAFKLHYEETGKTGNAWGTRYLNWYKFKIKWKIEDEQKAEQRERFTDASGRPISEGQYVARQVTKQVLSDLERGVLTEADYHEPF
jgi:hypothetical protein